MDNEEKQIRRTKEHYRNLQESVKDLEAKYRRQVRQHGLNGEDNDNNGRGEDFMELDQVELMNKINRLERDLIHKEKEYKIMSLRIRDASQEIPGALRHRRKSLVQISRNGTSPRRLVKSAAKYRTSQQEAAHPILNQKEDIWEKKKQIQE